MSKVGISSPPTKNKSGGKAHQSQNKNLAAIFWIATHNYRSCFRRTNPRLLSAGSHRPRTTGSPNSNGPVNNHMSCLWSPDHLHEQGLDS